MGVLLGNVLMMIRTLDTNNVRDHSRNGDLSLSPAPSICALPYCALPDCALSLSKVERGAQARST